ISRIMGILVGVENICGAELSDGDDDAVGGLRSRELIDAGIDLLSIPAEVDGLAQEHARNAAIGNGKTDLVGFAAGEARDAKRAAQPKALVDLRIDPKLGALPQLHASIEGYVPSLAALVAVEAVLSNIGRMEWRRVLPEQRGLSVQAEIVVVER